MDTKLQVMVRVTGFKETAFAYAISAAGVTHQVSKACSMGKLKSCGCDMSEIHHGEYSTLLHHPLYADNLRKMAFDSRSTAQWLQERDVAGRNPFMPNAAAMFEWGGCSHNVEFGEKYARRFLNYKEESRDVNSQINLHNNRAGRLVRK